MTALWLAPVLTRVRLTHLLRALSSRSNRSSNWRRYGVQIDFGGNGLGSDVFAGAVPGNVSWLVASVASLAGGVERTTSWRSALLTDVSQFAASIALHSLRLAVTSKVIGTTALVARSGAACLEPAAAKATLESASADGSATADTNGPRALAIALSYVSRLQRAIRVFSLTAK